MTEERNYDEIQSKTVLLEDNDGVNDMLSALNTGRDAMDKKRKAIKRAALQKKIAIFFAVISAAFLIFVAVYKLL